MALGTLPKQVKVSTQPQEHVKMIMSLQKKKGNWGFFTAKSGRLLAVCLKAFINLIKILDYCRSSEERALDQ